MADWLLLVRAVALVSLPCLLLIYTLLLGAPPQPPAPPQVSHRWLPRPPHSQRTVLVTGGAGFIGFHVAQELRRQWGPSAVVVGVDIFSEYYDVQLKQDRASELVRHGVKIYRADVCDRTFLSHLFTSYNFTDVVHMAAQAGVRHSMRDPTAYVRANIQCFLSLLDSLKGRKHTSLVFASSSSVYGRDAPLPFSTHSPPHPPGNMYAALKISNEHFAQAYCSQHGVQTVGLRLFTVYGPWGRPDMAVYKFADNMLNGRPVPVFDPGPSHSLMRDFTYVNDTVAGVLAALDHTPLQCGEVYNVGSGHPISLHTMLHQLQQELNITSTIEHLPLPPSDLYSTFADISETQRVLHYQPHTSLQEGLRLFVSWLRDYRNERSRWESSGRWADRNQPLQVELEARERELRELYWRHEGEVNNAYRNRISGLKDRYTDYAQKHGISLPKLQKRRFIYYPGMDSPGSTVIMAPGYHGNIVLLQDRCLRTEQCVAFTGRGEFKNHLRSRETWTNSSDGKGIYVADIDICASDLHDCGPHSHCKPTGPGTHTCLCQDGYIKLGRICVERYVEGVSGREEKEWRLTDELEGREWEEQVDGRDFVFFQGLDSPGGDYMVVERGGGDVGRLREACVQTYRCIAFNTNGVLKHSLRPPQHWMQWSSNPHHGLYVRDVDYCSLDVEQCPTHSYCLQHSPGNYSCACEPPWVMGREYQCVRGEEEAEEVEVIVSVDLEHLPGLVTVMTSVLRHSSLPVMFNVVVAGKEANREDVEGWLHCHGVNGKLEVVEGGAGDVRRLVRVYSRPEDVGNLASPANFARFQFHTLFPRLRRAIYLDADTVVRGDIAQVWRRLVGSRKVLVAVPRSSPSYGSVFSNRVKQLFQQRYGHTFQDSDPTFNAGVYGVNFDLWRQKNIHKEVLYWMEQQAKEPLWGFGTQPIMLLAVYGQWEHLDPQWNINGLGWKEDMSLESLEGASLLHWSGKRKPWLPDGLYRELWQQHLPPACSDHGRCVRVQGGGYRCQCAEGYSGQTCQETAR